MNYNKIIIKLFKRFYGDIKTNDFSTRALHYGILIPNVDDELVDYAISLYGKDGELFNSTFHKDFNTVKNTNLLDLLIEQSLHYLTTYGTNFTSPYVYIPKEELHIPNLNLAEIKLINICEIDKVELRNKIITLCSAALSSETVEDVVTLINYFEFFDIVNEISNKEVKCILCSILGVVPSDPNEMLRYMIYLATGTTLKIKNQGTLRLIKVMMSYNYEKVNDALKLYISQYGYNKLASIFITNKDLFLMFKNSDNASIINKLSKLGKKKSIKINNSKGIKDCFTDTNITLSAMGMDNALNSMSIYKELALLDTLNYVSANPDYMEYKIRNGKTYFTEAKKKDQKEIIRRRNFVYGNLISKMYDKLNGKTFHIPNGIKYALPTSEKNFIGSIPNKSKLELHNDDALIIAIAWEIQCDLDLSIIDNKGNKVGWNGDYTSNNARTIFSGDMTCLDDNGKACEAIFIDADKYNGTVQVNLYSNASGLENVPFKLIIAKADRNTEEMTKNYAVNPNDVIYTANLSTTNRSLNIGTFEINEKDIVFTFDLDNMGNRIVSSFTDVDKMRLAVNNLKNEIQLTLNDFLVNCGVNVITEVTDDIEYTDLSLENISKETLFEIFS